MFERPRRILGWFVLAAAAGAACGKSKSHDDDDGDSGQVINPAGASGRGGGAGGRAGRGGRTSGGFGAVGGVALTGGSGATGGTDAEGGAPENGGVAGLGGEGAETSGGTDSAGGADTGGTGASGGDAASAGDAAGGGDPAGGGSAGSAWSPSCGDAHRDPGDECDDGNHVNGDGCHSDCTIEGGFVCYSARCDDDGCSLPIPAVFRDFNSGPTVGHPDFQPGYSSERAVQGLVEPLLDDEGKPVLASGWSVSESFIHSKAGFAEWYRDGAPSGGPIPGQIVLWDDGTGRYVNRWGKQGEQFPISVSQLDLEPVVYGGPGGTGCEACVPSPTGACYDPCIAWDSMQACCAEIPEAWGSDGTPLFFPIDEGTGLLSETRWEAKVPQEYGWIGYPWEDDLAVDLGVTAPLETAHAPFPSPTHNFSFTSEVKAWFRYESDQPLVLEIGGDDDVWLFINGRLAVDLGAWHTPLEGTVTISGGVVASSAVLDSSGTTVTESSSVGTFGLVDGNVYPIAVFHAERQREVSTFKLALKGTNPKRSVCVPEP